MHVIVPRRTLSDGDNHDDAYSFFFTFSIKIMHYLS